VIVGGLPYLTAPELLPVASIARTTLYDSTSPSGTWPKTTCLPSSHEVTTVVTKNWEPFLCDVRSECIVERVDVRVGTCVGHGQEERLCVLELEVLVGKLVAVDGLAAGTLICVSQESLPKVSHPLSSMG
jgi:hypothetical protein